MSRARTASEKNSYIRELELENDNLREEIKALQVIIEDMDWRLLESEGDRSGLFTP